VLVGAWPMFVFDDAVDISERLLLKVFNLRLVNVFLRIDLHSKLFECVYDFLS